MSSVLNFVEINFYLNISIVGWDGKSNLYPTVISIIIFNAIMKAIKKTNIVPPVYIALFHLLTHCVYQAPLIHYTTMEWERVNINRIDIDLHHTAYDLETKFYCFWIMGGIRHKIGVYISIILVIFFLPCKCRDILILVILYYGWGSCECRNTPNWQIGYNLFMLLPQYINKTVLLF